MGDKKTIWVVEDSTSAMALLLLKLKATGHNIVPIPTTDKAVERLQNSSERPDLLISDQFTDDENHKPSKITGVELIEIAKKAGIAANILTSGDDLVSEAKKAGADFFQKAGTDWPEKLKTRVIELLGQVQTSHQVSATR